MRHVRRRQRVEASERRTLLLRALAERDPELHDVGKVAIPDLILRKPGPLDPHEAAVMRRHAEIGEAMVLESPGLAAAAALARASHERWHGAGYPDGLAGGGAPARRADRRGLRRLQRDAPSAAVRHGALRRRGARGAAPLCGDAVRPRVVAACCGL